MMITLLAHGGVESRENFRLHPANRTAKNVLLPPLTLLDADLILGDALRTTGLGDTVRSRRELDAARRVCLCL